MLLAIVRNRPGDVPKWPKLTKLLSKALVWPIAWDDKGDTHAAARMGYLVTDA